MLAGIGGGPFRPVSGRTMGRLVLRGMAPRGVAEAGRTCEVSGLLEDPEDPKSEGEETDSYEKSTVCLIEVLSPYSPPCCLSYHNTHFLSSLWT